MLGFPFYFVLITVMMIVTYTYFIIFFRTSKYQLRKQQRHLLKLKHENEIGKTAMLPHPPSFLS